MPQEQGSSNPQNTEKITVTGRIGQAAKFRTIEDKGLLVGNMSIAEHPNANTSVWHEVALFGERAKKVQDLFDAGELRVGQEVEVVGIVHRRERPTKDGGTKEVEQIYASSVKPVRRDTTLAEPETSESPDELPGPEDSFDPGDL